jgi:hypothetical protein
MLLNGKIFVYHWNHLACLMIPAEVTKSIKTLWTQNNLFQHKFSHIVPLFFFVKIDKLSNKNFMISMMMLMMVFFITSHKLLQHIDKQKCFSYAKPIQVSSNPFSRIAKNNFQKNTLFHLVWIKCVNLIVKYDYWRKKLLSLMLKIKQIKTNLNNCDEKFSVSNTELYSTKKINKSRKQDVTNRSQMNHTKRYFNVWTQNRQVLKLIDKKTFFWPVDEKWNEI